MEAEMHGIGEAIARNLFRNVSFKSSYLLLLLLVREVLEELWL